jgi:hypothetical protein
MARALHVERYTICRVFHVEHFQKGNWLIRWELAAGTGLDDAIAIATKVDLTGLVLLVLGSPNESKVRFAGSAAPPKPNFFEHSLVDRVYVAGIQ